MDTDPRDYILDLMGEELDDEEKLNFGKVMTKMNLKIKNDYEKRERKITQVILIV